MARLDQGIDDELSRRAPSIVIACQQTGDTANRKLALKTRLAARGRTGISYDL